MLSSNVFNDAKLRARVRRVSILVCGTLAFVPILMGLQCPPTVITGCTDDAGCDDSVACTADSCDLSGTTGVCVNADNCTGLDTCNTTNGACEAPTCDTDADCDDNDACTGTETCVANLCAPGTPVDCDDADECTTDTCDSATGACTNTDVVCTAPETCNPTDGTCSIPCTADADCDDTLFCTGTETCDIVNSACVPGTDPCGANETCNDDTDECTAIEGEVFELTTDVAGDAFNGTPGNDIFNASVGTLQGLDILVGNGGNNDVLNATLAGGALSVGPPFATLIDIDVVNLTTLNTTTFDATSTTAIGIWNIMPGSTGSFAITNIEADPVFTLGSGYAKMLIVTLGDATGGADKIDVTLNGTATGGGISTLDNANIETLNIDVTADSSITATTPGTSFFGTAVLNNAKNVVVTGSGMLTFAGGQDGDLGLDTFDWTGFTGNTGASMVNAPGAVTNVSTLPNFVRYTINDTGTSNHGVTFANAHNNVTVDLLTIPANTAAGTLDFTQGTNNDDSLTVNYGGAGTGSAQLDASAGTEFLTINSGGTTTNAIVNVLTNTAVPFTTTSLTVIGTQNITLGTVTTESLDASALTGTMGMTAAASMQIEGGTNVDTIVGSGAIDLIDGNGGGDIITGMAGADTIDGGAGADTIGGGAGADTMTGGADADTFNFPLTADVVANTPDTINDYATGASGDILAFNAASFGINAGTVDEIIDGWESVAGAAHNKDAEITVITTAVVGALTSANAATAIGSATAAYAIGDDKFFVVSNGTDSAVFEFVSDAGDATVIAAELDSGSGTPGPIIIMLGVDSAELAAMVAANFAFGAS